MAKENSYPTVRRTFGFGKCADVHPAIDAGKFDRTTGTFVIPDLGIEIPPGKIADFLIHGLKRALTQDTSGVVSAATIDAEIEVWRLGYPNLPAWRKGNKPVTASGTGTGKGKLPFGRIVIESEIGDILGHDDPRVTKIVGFDDERFALLIEAKRNEGYIKQALDSLTAKAEAKAEADRIAALSSFDDLGL